MDVLSAVGFDRLAPAYQNLWTGTQAGRLQRDAVWHHLARLFPAGSRVLDLGCGTGDDALMLAARGVRVTGIDASSEMVRIARSCGVDARLCPIERVGEIGGPYDGVLSNFGALNCVEHLADLRGPLSGIMPSGGWLAVCLMSRLCLWETIWYGLHGRFGEATRRWNGEAASTVTSRVFYPTLRAVCRAFEPDFKLAASHGIGVAVPPSYVTGLSDRTFGFLGSIDKHIASLPGVRSLGDHRLLIFRKVIQCK
jgi:SAM-dependent methyltransferase